MAAEGLVDLGLGQIGIQVLQDNVAVLAELALVSLLVLPVAVMLDGLAFSCKDLPASDFDLRHRQSEFCVIDCLKDDLGVAALLIELDFTDGPKPREEAVEVALHELLAFEDAEVGVRVPPQEQHIRCRVPGHAARNLRQVWVAFREPLGLSPAEDAVPVEHERSLIAHVVSHSAVGVSGLLEPDEAVAAANAGMVVA